MIMFIYEIKNIKNQKRYFGKVDKKRKTIEKRFLEHVNLAEGGGGYCLHNAMRKFGIENFTVRQVCICSTKEATNKMERYFIAKYKTNRYKYGDRFGYNLTDGGDGRSDYHPTEETRQKMSKAGKGRIFTKEHKEKIRQATLRQHSDKDSEKKLINGILKSFQKEDIINKMRLKAKKQWLDKRKEMIEACFNDKVRNKRSESQLKRWEIIKNEQT